MRPLILFLLFFSQIVFAQTPFPLSFYWTGEIEDKSAFEMRVNMYESDRLLSGKGSKIKGECLYWADSIILKVDGEIKDNLLSINCFDSLGKMIYSFEFQNAEGLKTVQIGRWTNGSDVKNCSLKTSDSEKLGKAMLTGFSVAVNQRRNDIIAEDSSFASNFAYLPKILYLPIGEGYRLDAKVFTKADYYGEDYLEFSDTISAMGTKTEYKLAWQLIKSKNTPEIFEIRQIIVNGKIQSFSIAGFQFLAGRWQKKEGMLKPNSLPTKIFNSPDKIIYFSKGGISKFNILK
jgi:hypothetical protein